MQVHNILKDLEPLFHMKHTHLKSLLQKVNGVLTKLHALFTSDEDDEEEDPHERVKTQGGDPFFPRGDPFFTDSEEEDEDIQPPCKLTSEDSERSREGLVAQLSQAKHESLQQHKRILPKFLDKKVNQFHTVRCMSIFTRELVLGRKH